jgi:DNA end-binding protein Ku
MRFAHEIRQPKDLDLPGARQSGTDKEMKLARQLLDTLSGDWDPEEYRDTYTEALRAVIEAKVEGKAIVTPETPKRPRVVNLMQALERSLRERPLAQAPGRRAPIAHRPRKPRRKAA